MDLSLDGDDDGILSILVMACQLGACRIGMGVARLNRSPSDPLNARLTSGLLDGLPETWSEAVEHFHQRGMEIGFSSPQGPVDLWAGNPQAIRADQSAVLWMVHGNGRAVLGSGDMRSMPPNEPPKTMVDAPTLVCGTSALLHRHLMERGLFWDTPISDRWLTLTARLDDIDPQEALELISSKFGGGTATSTVAGDGSLIRFRLPLEETPEDLLEVLEQDRKGASKTLEGPIDVGPFPALSEDGSTSFDGQNLPPSVGAGDFLVLGAGGTGSWAAPLILSGCDGLVTMTIVDGDQKVESHNLNRQILYETRNLGSPKALAAREALAHRFPALAGGISAIPRPLGPQHVFSNETGSEGEEVSLAEIIGEDDGYDEQIVSSLDSMGVALACLDNQSARTTLNRACLDRGRVMVNGGGEGVSGIVEAFDGESCMVCRYGEQEAKSVERISCQEEGARPVISIVTTTAYVGAMMAAMALCVVARARNPLTDMPEARDWASGSIQKRHTGRLPWFEGECASHL